MSDRRTAAMVSIAGKIGGTAETPRKQMRRVERCRGPRAGATSSEESRIRTPERENHELHQNHLVGAFPWRGRPIALLDGEVLRSGFSVAQHASRARQ
jgi:hypothetical protein